MFYSFIHDLSREFVAKVTFLNIKTGQITANIDKLPKVQKPISTMQKPPGSTGGLASARGESFETQRNHSVKTSRNAGEWTSSIQGHIQVLLGH
jgi:hypothetical protein